MRHPRLPRLEALKILPASVSADPEYRQRFAREADIAASLWHPHVVAVHDRGEHDGQLWIAMDYVEGTDAAQLMRDRYPHGMPSKDAVEIVSAIADALDYAHERYLLHRDVKPANILLTDPRKGDRRILLADFGIAKAANETNGLTATNVTVGSVAYAAPEQLTGKALDGRADQYALACTAFHLLTGEPPFANSNPAAVIGSHLSSPPPRLGSLRADLGSIENVLAKGMAKEPFQRFDTCREFASALSHGDVVWTGSAADTQLATNISPPPRDETYHEQTAPIGSATASASRTAAMIAIGIAALLAVGVVAFVGARLAQSPSAAADGVAASAEFDAAGFTARRPAGDGDPHGDRHPAPYTAEHRDPTSPDAASTTAARRPRIAYADQLSALQRSRDRIVGKRHHSGYVCRWHTTAVERPPRCVLPTHRSILSIPASSR